MARYIAFAFLFCSLMTPPLSLASPPARVECDYGDAWAEMGNWKRAVSHYQKALEHDPQLTTARLGLTHGLHNLGDRQRALKELEALTQLPSEDAGFACSLGAIQLDMDRPHEACGSFSKVLTREKNHERALFGSGQCLQAIFDRTRKPAYKQRAIQAYLRYLESFPGGSRAESAQQALHVLIFAEAGRIFIEAQAAFSDGDYHRARKLLNRVVARRPDMQAAHYLLGMTLASPQIGKHKQAERELAKAGDMKEALLQRGIIAYEEEDLKRAEHLLGKAVKKDPGFARAHYYLGLVHRDRLKDERAKAAFRRVIELAPGSTLAERASSKLQVLSGDIRHLAEGDVLDTASQVRLGRMLSKRIEKRFGLVEDPRVERKLNRVLKLVAERMDGLPLAVPYRIKILNIDGVNALSFIDGTIYLFRGLVDFIRLEMNDSDDVYASVIGHEVVHVVMRHGLTMLDLKGGSRALTQGKPFDVRNLKHLMVGLSRTQEYQADQLGCLYAYRAGFDPAASLHFHRKLIMTGKEVPGDLDHPTHAERAEHLKEYLLGLRSKVRHFDAGLKALRGNEHDTAILHFEIFLGFFPSSLSARNNLGVAMHRLALSRSKLQRDYKLSTDIDPDNRIKRIRLREKGEALNRALMTEAAEIFRSMEKIAPDYSPARTNLAASLLLLGHKKSARKVFESVVAKSPDCVQARTNLAVLDLMDGNFEPGMSALAKIVKQKPGFADAHYNLGLAYLRSGRKDEARKSFRAYLGLDKESGWARIAANHLKSL